MTTLIAVYTSQGCIGRCDARCYEATHPECTCVCGGRNHGKGRTQSITNTRHQAQRWIADDTRAHDLHDIRAEIHHTCHQLPLWSTVHE
jgi:hypothetical protein